MRIKESRRNFFLGTHKGATIQIDREGDGRFYILVWMEDGCLGYDGWAPDDIRTMRDAKREAIRGACLDARPSPTGSG